MTTPVPFNDLSRRPPDVRLAFQAAVGKVIERGWYLLGPETEAFEDEFATYCGAAGSVGVANGTDALELALRAVGCTRDDEVILAANAGNYATTACRAIGAVPVYADVDPATLLLDPVSVGRVATEGTRAVVATHLYGNVVDVDALRPAVPPTAAVVEDGAQAHGASLRGRRVGSLGEVAAFSFYPTKNLGALGDAGAVVASAPDVLHRARQLRQYGWSDRYVVDLPGGRNSRIDEVQAAVLRVLLPRLDEDNDRRRAISRRYHEVLTSSVAPVTSASHTDQGVAHLFVVRSPDRADLQVALADLGIQSAVHYPVPDHRQPSVVPGSYRADSLTVTELAASQVLSLPCFPALTDAEVDRVVGALEVCQAGTNPGHPS